MTLHPMPPVPEEIAQRIAKMIANGMEQQEVLCEMRAAGLHIVDCMRLTRDLYKIGQGEAKVLVHESDAWASMRGEYDAVHDLAEEAAVRAGFAEVPVTETLQRAS